MRAIVSGPFCPGPRGAGVSLPARARLALAFYSATALPVVVAITQLGVAKRLMQPGIAAALVGAA